MTSQTISYTVDGLSMVGQLFRPSGADSPSPAILVFPEAFGLTDFTLSRAQQLADDGYIALACDYYGDARIFEDADARRAAVGPLLNDPATVRARANAALGALLAQPQVDPTRVAAIGYCFGGTMALELACSGAAIAAVVGFHCGLGTVSLADAHAIRGRILLCLGADDPSITPEHRAAFETALHGTGVDWQLHLYGGVVHAFTNPHADGLGRPDFARYDANADGRSWAAMSDLLAATLAAGR